MTELVVRACGPRTSLQDFGRIGFQRYGVSNSGAMDRLALAVANTLVGNGPGMGAIEFMLIGGTFLVEGGSVRVAVAGAPCAITLDGQPMAHSASFVAQPGQILTVGAMQAGVYAYLSIAGGVGLTPQLGSLSLHQRAALGGFHGRTFEVGDRIPLRLDKPPEGPSLVLHPVPIDAQAPIRIIFGPQDDYFTDAGIGTLLSASYMVSQEADRMGYRLTGPKIEHAHGFNIVSDGIVSGSIQVPGSGEPIIMMADRQTTGGYPKIATVISVDLRFVAQRRPGEALRFKIIGMDEAQSLARERGAEIAALAGQARPIYGGLPPIEELLALNLAGAAVDAMTSDQ